MIENDDKILNLTTNTNQRENSLKFFDYLEEKKEDFCIQYFKNINNKAWTLVDEHGFTPLHKSIYFNLQSLTYIIITITSNNISEKDFNTFINAKTDKGYTALHYASFLGDIISIKLLIKNRADVLARTSAGFSVIHFSCQSNKLTSMFYFVSKFKMDINSKDKKGNTCLHIACYYGSNYIINYLLSQKNIKINEKNNDGYTPLHYCVLCKNERVSKKLLILSVDINTTNNKREKAIDIAEKNQLRSMVKLLSGVFVLFPLKINHPYTVYIFHIMNLLLVVCSIYLIQDYVIVYIIWCVFIFFLFAIFYFIDPSIKAKEINLMNEIEKNNMLIEDYCTICNIKHNKKNVHCFICRKCISDFDHHCIWLGKCIGDKNKKMFLILLIFILINYFINIIITTERIWKERKLYRYYVYFIFGFNLLIFGLSAIVIIPLIKLYCKQSHEKSSNNIELYKIEKKNLLSSEDMTNSEVLINSI